MKTKSLLLLVFFLFAFVSYSHAQEYRINSKGGLYKKCIENSQGKALTDKWLDYSTNETTTPGLFEVRILRTGNYYFNAPKGIYEDTDISTKIAENKEKAWPTAEDLNLIVRTPTEEILDKMADMAARYDNPSKFMGVALSIYGFRLNEDAATRKDALVKLKEGYAAMAEIDFYAVFEGLMSISFLESEDLNFLLNSLPVDQKEGIRALAKHSMAVKKNSNTPYPANVPRPGQPWSARGQQQPAQNPTVAQNISGKETFEKGFFYYRQKEYSEAKKWWLQSASTGQAEAMFNLAIMYQNGYGEAVNYTEAFKWFYKAAEKGNDTSMFNVGMYYVEGKGVAQNYSEAKKWFERVANKGFLPAMYNLGVMHGSGMGVPQDHSEAFKWYQKAAEGGAREAMYNLGTCYYNGIGVAQNHTESFKWMKKSAELGFVNGMYYVGRMYYFGTGVTKNLKESEIWMKRAAENNFEQAKEFVASHSFENKGTHLDRIMNTPTKTSDLSNSLESKQKLLESLAEMPSEGRKSAAQVIRESMERISEAEKKAAEKIREANERKR